MDRLSVTFLGTGTSTGVPQLGCNCAVCTSTDPRDKRFRSSILVETSCTSVLIDCGPDFRAQMLRMKHFPHIHAVLLTHEHYDHVGGIDDLRPYNAFGTMHIYADQNCARHIRERLPYCFVNHKYPGIPQLALHECQLHKPFEVGDMQILPLKVMHGNLPILGCRIGRLAYLTDIKSLPEEEYSYLNNLDLLIIGALRHEPHATHQSIDEAINMARRIQARQTYLIHMSHHAGSHEALEKSLPNGIHAAYDMLHISC